MKSKYLIFLYTLFSSFFLNDCRSVPPTITPTDNSVSIIGLELRINLEYYPEIFPQAPITVYLAKEGNGKTIYNQTDLIEASHVSGNRFYFLNMKPGKYALVGCKSSYTISSGGTSGGVSVSASMKSDFKVAFNEDILKFSEVNVSKSGIYYLGNYKIVTKSFGKDDVARHYHSVFYDPQEIQYMPDYLPGFLFGNEDLKENSQELRNDFINDAKKDLKNTDWLKFLI